MKQWHAIDWPVWAMLALVLTVNTIMGSMIDHSDNGLITLMAFVLFGLGPLLLLAARIRRPMRFGDSRHFRVIRSDRTSSARLHSDESAKRSRQENAHLPR